jgi:hypothetical protein
VGLRLDGGQAAPEPAGVRVRVDGRELGEACRHHVDLAWPPRRLDVVLDPPGGAWSAGEHDVRVEAPGLDGPVLWTFTVD